MDLTSALGLGALAGLAVAVPVGPVGVLLLREGVVHGTRVALGAALGVATVDLLYAVVAVVVGAPVGRAVAAHGAVVRWATAAVLLAVGVVALRDWVRGRRLGEGGTAAEPGAVDVDAGSARPVHDAGSARPVHDAGSARPVSEVDARAARRASDADARTARRRVLVASPAAAYVRFVGLTAVNPTTALTFATVAVGLAARLGTDDRAGAVAAGALFVVGAGLASALWQVALAVASGALGRVVGERGRSWASLVGVLVVIALAVLVAVG